MTVFSIPKKELIPYNTVREDVSTPCMSPRNAIIFRVRYFLRGDLLRETAACASDKSIYKLLQLAVFPQQVRKCSRALLPTLLASRT